MADSTRIPRATAATSAETVPGRPAWMSVARESAQTVETAAKVSRPPSRSATVPTDDEIAGEVDAPISWKLRLLLWLTSAAATGYGLSLILHAMILGGMALYVFPTLMRNDGITTVVESDTEMPEEFDPMQDVQLDAPAGNEEIVKPQHTEMIEQDAEITQLAHDFLTDVTAAETEGEGGSTSGTGGGFRLLEPKNAVRRGSFSAWTIPIPQRAGEEPKAGDSPRPGQSYYIVIQVRVDEGRRTYKISDLSGSIVGTDGYRQFIPNQTFVQERDGQLSRAKMGRLLPIVDGVVQILVQVPGADALVKDTVNVKSRSLKEEQTLELIFGK